MGLDWNKLKATLNPTFDWDSAVQAALRSTDSIEDVCILYFAIELKGIHILKPIVFCLRKVCIVVKCYFTFLGHKARSHLCSPLRVV